MLVKLAPTLGRAVARGDLSPEHADAAIVVAVAREYPGDVTEPIRIWRHILSLNVRNYTARRETASGAISRILRPLIDLHRPYGAIMAQAFDVNEDNGAPLSESDVKDLVETQLYWAMKKPRGTRHGH